jgi:hypothetical protein
VQAQDSWRSDRVSSASVTITVAPAALQITTGSLGSVVYQQAYQSQLAASGGTGSTVWSVVGGALPSGVLLGANGSVSGVPTAIGTFAVTVRAVDANWPQNQAAVSLSLVVSAPVLNVTVSAAPSAQVGVLYQGSANATGVVGTPVWSLASGTWPAGVTLDATTGAIAGVPSAYGVFSAAVQLRDSYDPSRVASAPLTITVAPVPLQITTLTLGSVEYRQTYQSQLAFSGGTGRAAWSIVAGALPSGVTLDAGGSLGGSPTSIGTFSVTVRAADANWANLHADATLSLLVSAPALVASLSPAAAAQVGLHYLRAASASGVVGTASWSIASGALPSGIGVDAATGAISGVPSAYGTFSAVLQLRDSYDASRVTTLPLTMTVAPSPLQITTSTLGSVVYRQSYQTSLAVAGGTGRVTWTTIGGALPSGVVLGADGSVSGVPTAIGTFAVTFHAVDANWPENQADVRLVLVVSAPVLGVTVSASPAAQVGVPYQGIAAVTGLVGSGTWSISSGALPPGIALNAATGAIAGVPSTYGAFTAMIQLQDSYDASRVSAASLSVVVAPTSIAITTTSVPSANAGSPFAATLGAVGGTGAFAWSLDSGALPDGITLRPNGALAGSSTALGTFTFSAKATDAGWPSNASTRTLTLSVTASEVVLYAADASVVSGAWARVADATAAGGARLSNVDKAAAKLANALAAPVNYFEMTFEAQAGVAYHLWMRGKADKNSWANDSVYVQFSGTVTAGGAPVYRIGTTSATWYSVEDGTNAGVAGWGWNDDSYDGFAAPLYFATSGPQTIRVQVREDGLSLDQMVLSSATYVTTSPGAFKNDATILPR